jgi:hypothetical protein
MPISDAIAVLHQAATATSAQDYPATADLVEALLQAEKQAKQQRLLYPASALEGNWRLRFSTGTRKMRQRGGIALGKGFYMPQFAPAQISFTDLKTVPDSTSLDQTAIGRIGNQIQLGGLRLKFTGPCRYPGKKNLLVFDFNEIQITLFNQVIYKGSFRSGKASGKAKGAKTERFEDRPVGQLPFFAFFWVSDRAIAARGRGGGLALWVSEGGRSEATQEER